MKDISNLVFILSKWVSIKNGSTLQLGAVGNKFRELNMVLCFGIVPYEYW